MLEIKIRQGAGGRWRWMAYDEDTTPDDPEDDRYRAGCTPYGFDTEEAALQDAISVFGSSMTITDSAHGPLFAGLRDFE